jgi:hypothetical protein
MDLFFVGLQALLAFVLGPVIGWMCVRYGMSEIRAARALRRYSVEIVGEVVGNEAYNSTEHGELHRPVVKYQSGGRSFLTYAPGKHDPIPLGTPMRVWHLPEDPASARAESPATVSFTGWAAAFCGVALVGMIAWTAWDVVADLLD